MPLVYKHDKYAGDIDFLVDGLFAKLRLTMVVGKPSAGKSWFIEWLVECIIHGIDFLGRKTHASSVLLIDQDTMPSDLYTRLDDMNRAIGFEPKAKITIAPMEGYRLSDMDKLVSAIDKSGAKVIVIDSLKRILGGKSDSLKAKDMEMLSELKSRVCNNGRTLIVVHHISSKCRKTVDQLMFDDNIDAVLFGSSTIVELNDAYFVVANDKTGKLKKLYVRPRPRRFSLPSTKPFTAILEEDKKKKTSKFVYEGIYTQKTPLMSLQKDVWDEVVRAGKIRVPELVVALDGSASRTSVQRVVEEMRQSAWLIRHVTSKHKIYYSPNPWRMKKKE